MRTTQHEKILSLDIDLTIDLSFINEAISLLDVEIDLLTEESLRQIDDFNQEVEQQCN